MYFNGTLSCIDSLVHGQDSQSCWAWWWLLALILFFFKTSSQLLKVTSTRSHFSSITHIQCLITTGPWKSNFSMPLLWHLWRAIPVPEIAVVLAKAFVVTVSQLSIFCPFCFFHSPKSWFWEHLLVVNFLHANLYLRSTSWNWPVTNWLLFLF